MLALPDKVLLLTKDGAFADRVRSVAAKSGIYVDYLSEWGSNRRVAHNVVICDCRLVPYLSRAYWYKTVVALMDGATSAPYRGDFDRFLFDPENKDEIACAMLRWVGRRVSNTDGKSADVTQAVAMSGTEVYDDGEVYIDFLHGKYLYKGEPMHLTYTQCRVLANWLLLGEKTSSTRVHLHRLRKIYGSDFLRKV